MRGPEKIIKVSITDDYNPNVPVKDRILMEETMDVLETVNLLKTFGIVRTRESLYALWKTPFRNISQSWWVDPEKYDGLLEKCPLSQKDNLRTAIERRSLHVNVQPFSRKGW